MGARYASNLLLAFRKNCGSRPHSDAQVDWLYNLTPTFNSTTHQNTLKTWVASFGLWRAFISKKCFQRDDFVNLTQKRRAAFPEKELKDGKNDTHVAADLRLQLVTWRDAQGGGERLGGGVTCSQTAVEVVQLSYFLVCVWSHEDSFI